MLEKKIAFGLSLTLALFVLSSCQQASSDIPQAKEQPVVAANVQKVSLDVQGMTCSGCEHSVESVIKKIDGVASVKANYADGTTEVRFDAKKANTDEFVKALDKIGFSAKAADLN